MVGLSDEDRLRYSRQILYPHLGEGGQKRLKGGRVLIAGMGGLGSGCALYLACAGIGRLILVDNDVVKLSNLNRQVLYGEGDLGVLKVKAATQRLGDLNAELEVMTSAARITAESLLPLLEQVDVVIDCLDNMQGRFILNEVCTRKGVPLIHGGVDGMIGEVTTVIPTKTPCLACIFPPVLETEGPVAVFGCTAGVVACLQVMEAIKLIAGFGEPLAGKMLYINGETMVFSLAELQKRSGCEVCGGAG